MEKDKTKEKSLISTLPGKLTALIGGGLALLNGSVSLDAKPVLPDLSHAITTEVVTTSTAKPLPAKLILRHAGPGYKIIAQHDSHSSHSSHSSHGSHSSHSSHSSHTSGGFA